jgi:hypothetical protein
MTWTEAERANEQRIQKWRKSSTPQRHKIPGLTAVQTPVNLGEVRCGAVGCLGAEPAGVRSSRILVSRGAAPCRYKIRSPRHTDAPWGRRPARSKVHSDTPRTARFGSPERWFIVRADLRVEAV